MGLLNPDPINDAFRRWLKQQVDQSNESQVAEKIGVAASQVMRWLDGERAPGTKSISAALEAFGQDFSALGLVHRGHQAAAPTDPKAELERLLGVDRENRALRAELEKLRRMIAGLHASAMTKGAPGMAMTMAEDDKPGPTRGGESG